MRFAEPGRAGFARANMTPMIDMAFQLIAFFMVVINFSKVDQNERIRLPASELAKPPDAPRESPITLQVTRRGSVIFGGEERLIDPGEPTRILPVANLRPALLRERQFLSETPGRNVADATVIIRADRDAKTGRVQELIIVCQEVGFETFALRAKQQERRLSDENP